jgi:outer membrane lipoprotein-sorting protein
MRRVLRPLIAVLALHLVTTAAAAEGDVVERVFGAARSVQHLEAEFTQVKQLKAFAQPVTSTGTLVYDRDGTVIWRYETPARMDFQLVGSRATISYPDLGEEQHFDLESDERFKPLVESMFVWLGGDLETVREAYDVSVDSGDTTRVLMAPRNEMIRPFVQRIVLTVDGDQQVQQVRIEEPDGDSTEISFHYTRVDRSDEQSPGREP